MEYKEQLQVELLEVIDDLKRIKYMHHNKAAIDAKRNAYEVRLNAILKALELIGNGGSTNGKPRIR